MLKKAGRFLSSMQFALILLGILILACVAGSFVSQGKTYLWYAETYSERVAGAIIALRLDDVFHSWWFVAITVFLCVNLVACNLVRIGPIVKQWKRLSDPERAVPENAKLQCETADQPDGYFAAMGFHHVEERKTEEGKTCKYAVNGRIGVWGAWICHLGILLLILGFGLGQLVKREYPVYGVPGQTKEIGDTGLLLTIDDFRTDIHEDGSVAQYTSELTVRDPKTGTEESGAASVNSPAMLYGYRVYQNSTGWACRVSVRKGGEELQEEDLCVGEYLPVKDKPELVIYFSAFYPDYEFSGGRPSTKSQELNNPAYLYTVYYQGNVLGMNVLMPEEQLTIDEYTVTFADPQTYTLLQVKKDPLAPAALAGGLITLIGLILALYVQPSGMVAVTEEDGRSHIRAWSRKGGAIFEDRFREVFGEYLNRAAEERTAPEEGTAPEERTAPEEGTASEEGAVSEEGRHDVSDEEETS